MNILLNSKPSPCLLINCTPNNVVVRNVFDRPFIITFVFSPTKPSANNEANQETAQRTPSQFELEYTTLLSPFETLS